MHVKESRQITREGMSSRFGIMGIKSKDLSRFSESCSVKFGFAIVNCLCLHSLRQETNAEDQDLGKPWKICEAYCAR